MTCLPFLDCPFLISQNIFNFFSKYVLCAVVVGPCDQTLRNFSSDFLKASFIVTQFSQNFHYLETAISRNV